jgi:hypothetical protein
VSGQAQAMWHDAISVVAFKLCVYWHVISQGQRIFIVEHYPTFFRAVSIKIFNM